MCTDKDAEALRERLFSLRLSDPNDPDPKVREQIRQTKREAENQLARRLEGARLAEEIKREDLDSFIGPDF